MTLSNSEQIAVNTDRLNKVEGHIETANREMGELRDAVVEVKQDLKWVKKFLWWVIGIVVAGFGGIGVALIDLIFNIKR